MIRELKNENEKLKQFLLQAAKQGVDTIDFKALGLEETNDLLRLKSQTT